MSESGGPRSPYISRRSALKGAGALALLAWPGSALLSACGSDSSEGSSTTANTTPTGSAAFGGGASAGASGIAAPATDPGATSIGSNYSDAAVKSAFADVFSAYPWGSGVTVNTVDHNDFQNNIQNYLQGTPNDVFCWFSGFRQKFFAAQGLVGPIDDVWETIGGHFSDAIKSASKGDDGHYYLVPWINYPWVMFYKKSVFSAKGYQVPATWDDFVTLLKKMQSDGFTSPIAIGQKDGWPAMGTFDILNMRINGYQFHVDLMAHKQSWTDPKVKAVFAKWAELAAYYTPGATGRTWQEAVQTFDANKESALIFQGTDQVGPQLSKESLDDLDFFPFPQIDPAYPTDSGIDAPIDGFLMSKSPKNETAAKALLTYLGTAAAEQAFLKPNPSDVGTADDYDTSTYTDLQKKSVDLISKTKNIAQFLDRDTRPDFAYPIVQNALNTFLNNTKDVDTVCNQLEQQAQVIFAT